MIPAGGSGIDWKGARWVVLAAVLVILLIRITATYRVLNHTVDEGGHLAAGLQMLERGAYTIEAQHPPVSRFVLAVLPYYVLGLRMTDAKGHLNLAAFEEGDHEYYWRSLTLARAGNLVFAVILLAVVFRWSSRLYGTKAGLLAAVLATCCPNLIAHASLATIDISATASTLMSMYFFWRWSREPRLRNCLAAAGAFSLAVLCKFSALAFLPPVAGLYFVVARARRWRQGDWSWRIGMRRALVFGLVFLGALWTAYLFRMHGLVPIGHRDTRSFRQKYLHPGRLVPDAFSSGLVELYRHNREGHTAYLLGSFSEHGWWYYFPVAVAIKTTLPMLALAAIGVAFFVRGRYQGQARETLYPLLAVLVILGISMMSSLNIGIRHVLVLYPFFAILGSGVVALGRRSLAILALSLTGWHAAESLITHPDYLAYFNQIARGREERFLLDSNLDWGQDLARLADHVRRHRINEVQLSYFGTAQPAKFGVPATPLDAKNPRPGWVAISVNSLMGLRTDPEQFRWFREREPTARVGKSIWLYYVP